MKLLRVLILMISPIVMMAMDAPEKELSEAEYQELLGRIAHEPKDIKLELALNLIITWARDLPIQEAVKKIKAITIINKDLEQKINEPAFCLRLIKTLANRSNISDQQAALYLNTKEAQRRLQIQEKFRKFVFDTSLTDDAFKKQGNEFIENGIDFNFTNDVQYNMKFGITIAPLLHELVNSGALYLRAIEFMLKNGENINSTDSFGNTPLMIYCMEAPYVANESFYYKSLVLLDLLLSTPNIQINKINRLSSMTALSYLIDNEFWSENLNIQLHNNLVTVVSKLLDAGADPKLSEDNIYDLLGLILYADSEMDIALKERIDQLLNK